MNWKFWKNEKIELYCSDLLQLIVDDKGKIIKWTLNINSDCFDKCSYYDITNKPLKIIINRSDIKFNDFFNIKLISKKDNFINYEIKGDIIYKNIDIKNNKTTLIIQKLISLKDIKNYSSLPELEIKTVIFDPYIDISFLGFKIINIENQDSYTYIITTEEN
jgi:hypothetical protein